MVKSSIGGEVYAFREMLGHMPTLREFFGRFSRLRPGMAGFEDREGLSTHLRNKKVATEKFLVRRCLATKQAFKLKELGNVYWTPGFGNPAAGLTKIKGDLAPLLRLLVSGSRNPGTLRPVRGAASCEH